MCHAQEPVVVVCPLQLDVEHDATLELKLTDIRHDFNLQSDLEVYISSSLYVLDYCVIHSSDHN